MIEHTLNKIVDGDLYVAWEGDASVEEMIPHAAHVMYEKRHPRSEPSFPPWPQYDRDKILAWDKGLKEYEEELRTKVLGE